jgi:hypothetical protein
MADKTTSLADDMRQRMNRKAGLILGLALLGLGLPALAVPLTLGFLQVLPLPAAAVLGAALTLMVILVSLGLASMQRARSKRSIELIEIADELGLTYQETAPSSLTEKLRDLEMFSTAGGLAGYNLLSGEFKGLNVMVLDCVVATGPATFENTIFVFKGVPRILPDFYLTPKDFLTRGKRGIGIPRQEEFNKRFLLQGDDARAIRKTFTSELVEVCLEGGNQNVEVRPPLLVVMRRGKRLPPKEWRRFLLGCVRLVCALGDSD